MLTHDPVFDPPSPSPKDVAGPESSAATSCLVWGIIAMFTWAIPPVGLLIAFAGLVRGYQGWNAPNRDRARVGVVLSTIALIMAAWIVSWIFQAASRPDF